VTSDRGAPLVTLAVTTLNRPRYLHETLAAVVRQDYPRLDVLVSDNGSTDETPRLARALAASDPRVRFRRNPATVPVHEHFNQCVRAARGKYFVLVNDDDRINPCFVSALVAIAAAHPDVAVVAPANTIIDEQGAVVRTFAPADGDVFEGAAFVSEWLRGALLANPTTLLLRTDVVRHFGGYQPFVDGRHIDNLLFLQCALTARVGFARQAVFSCRRHGDSRSAGMAPERVGASGRAFIRHLRRDAKTAAVLARLPRRWRRRVLDGVGELTALEALSTLAGEPFDRRLLARLFAMRRDGRFVYVVLREYLRHTAPALHRRLRSVRRLAPPAALEPSR
jgi:glycosyltransferase involved in cell wall biosynthesis